MAKDFKSVGTSIRKAIDGGQARGINRALSAGRTEMTKLIKADTGLDKKVIRQRVGIKPAYSNKQYGWLFVGFKIGIKISEFKPKTKTIMIAPTRTTAKGRGRPRTRKYFGTTIKVGSASREIFPGVFPTQSRQGIPLWLGRKKAFVSNQYVRGKTARTPTFTPRINPLKDSAIKHEARVTRVVNESIGKNVAHEISYRLSKIK